MSRCFGSSSKLSAKEYTCKKRNNNMFCELRGKYIANGNKPVGTTDACVNQKGEISHFINNTVQLQIKKGHEDFFSINDVDSSTNHIGQQFKNHFCSPYNDIITNTDISNNYTGDILTFTDTPHTFFTENIFSYTPILNQINQYAEISTTNLNSTDLFPSGKQIIYENCPTRRGVKVIK
uniref:Uncharacterized protein n=1 Tax=viral metagenome TaxID=1070528 RepID=A0A6C0J9T8_9ZZZZ